MAFGEVRRPVQPARTQRPSSAGTGGPATRVAGLDGVRGLAVLLVVLSHARVPWFTPGGIEGVTTFFVLSGFLITGLLLKEHRVTGRIDLLAFWGRRALRLLPALFLFVAVIASVYALAGWDQPRKIIVWTRPVLLYYGNFQLIGHGPLGPFRHTWSLAVEEQFYLVWPLLLAPALLLLRGVRHRRLWLLAGMAGLTGLSLGWRFMAGLIGSGGWVALAPQTTVFSMTAGACLAVLYERGWRPGRWAGAVSLAGASAYFWFPEVLPQYAGWVVGPAVYSALALIVIACAAGERWTVFAWRPLRALGTVSYGWYLWHFPVLLVIASHLHVKAYETAVTWAGIVGSLLVAAMSWRFLERPLQRRFRRRLERVHLVPAVEPATGPASTGPTGTGPTGTEPTGTEPTATGSPGTGPDVADLVGPADATDVPVDVTQHRVIDLTADAVRAAGTPGQPDRLIDLTALERGAERS